MQIIYVGPTKSRLQFSEKPQSVRLPRTQTGTSWDFSPYKPSWKSLWPGPTLNWQNVFLIWLYLFLFITLFLDIQGWFRERYSLSFWANPKILLPTRLNQKKGFWPQCSACAFLWAKLGFMIFFLQIYRPIKCLIATHLKFYIVIGQKLNLVIMFYWRALLT